jgi:hypothetical protein
LIWSRERSRSRAASFIERVRIRCGSPPSAECLSRGTGALGDAAPPHPRAQHAHGPSPSGRRFVRPPPARRPGRPPSATRSCSGASSARRHQTCRFGAGSPAYGSGLTLQHRPQCPRVATPPDADPPRSAQSFCSGLLPELGSLPARARGPKPRGRQRPGVVRARPNPAARPKRQSLDQATSPLPAFHAINLQHSARIKGSVHRASAARGSTAAV